MVLKETRGLTCTWTNKLFFLTCVQPLQFYHSVEGIGGCANCCRPPKQQQQHVLTTTWNHLIPPSAYRKTTSSFKPSHKPHPIHQKWKVTLILKYDLILTEHQHWSQKERSRLSRMTFVFIRSVLLDKDNSNCSKCAVSLNDLMFRLAQVANKSKNSPYLDIGEKLSGFHLEPVLSHTTFPSPHPPI